MDSSITPRLDAAPRLAPTLPATKVAAAEAAGPTIAPARTGTDDLGVKANPREALGKARPTKVDLNVVKVPEESKEQPGFMQRALNFFANALSYVSVPSLDTVAKALNLEFLMGNGKKLTPEGQKILSALATTGLLAGKDDRGETLRDTIDKMLTAGSDPKLLEGILGQLERPGSIRQMRNKSTCPTAVIQRLLAEVNPAAYTQAASELLEKGAATLPDGTKIAVSERNMAYIKEHTHSVSERINALFQVAMAEAVVAPDSYDVKTDSVEKAIQVAGTTMEWREDNGLDFKKVVSTYRRARMPLFDPRIMANAPAAEQRAVFEGVMKKLGTNEGLAVPVKTIEDGYHMVEALGMDAAGAVRFRDPNTGEEATYSWDDFNAVMGYDITDASNIGGGRTRPPTGGGGTGL